MNVSSLLFSSMDVTRQCFFHSPLAFAIVNLKPIVPGHVLLIPKRVVPRLSDLHVDEIHALFDSVQHVGKVIQGAYKGDGLTITCQDGKAAGQTVPHLHVHIIPRRYVGDPFEDDNNAIYGAIDKAENDLREVQALKVDDEQRPARTQEEMECEATWLRRFFSQ